MTTDRAGRKSSVQPRVRGVEMSDGSRLYADVVVAGCSPHHALLDLLSSSSSSPSSSSSTYNNPTHHPRPPATPILPPSFTRHLHHTDFSCGAFKINCAVNSLPTFSCYPWPKVTPYQHTLSIHPIDTPTNPSNL